jgi:hypothetical protein
MRRFLNSKLGIVALVVAVVTLITGVTWAATGPVPGSSTNSQELTSSVVEIMAVPLIVQVNGSLEVAGAGFTPGETVLFTIVVGGAFPLILQGGEANSSGAFLADTTANLAGRLPDLLVPDIYTIQAQTPDGGIVASAPLIVVEKKE